VSAMRWIADNRKYAIDQPIIGLCTNESVDTWRLSFYLFDGQQLRELKPCLDFRGFARIEEKKPVQTSVNPCPKSRFICEESGDSRGLNILEARGSMATDRFKLLSAVHLFLVRDGQVLLSRRFNTGYEDGKYSVVAGHLNGDEEVKAAMIREAREEVGVEISPLDLQVVGVMHRKSNDERIDFFLVTTSWSGEVTNREPGKCDQLAWFDLDELPENVIPYVRKALDNYRKGNWFDSFGWS
jgi:8-oxo-dGTP diphosphatase